MPLPVTPSNPTVDSGYKQLNVTIAATGVAQPLSITKIACSEFALQIPFGGAKIHVGGKAVLITTGMELDPPIAGNLTPDVLADYIDDLSKVYVIGTIATVVHVLYRTL